LAGNYRLHREPLDTEVTWEEPTGETYQLEFFECEMALRRVLHIEEDLVNTILDRLWNFHHVQFSTEDPRIVRALRHKEHA
jgi:hypothetical protein